jgi:hypothetical protein
VPCSSEVVRCCGLPITFLLVSRRATSRIVLAGGGVTMGSLANISGDTSWTSSSSLVVASTPALVLPALASAGAKESCGTDD